MTDEMILDPLQTSQDPNEGLEGIACDPWNKKLYVAQETKPRRIFSVDVETGIFEILLDIENNPTWSDLVDDVSGVRTSGISLLLRRNGHVTLVF